MLTLEAFGEWTEIQAHIYASFEVIRSTPLRVDDFPNNVRCAPYDDLTVASCAVFTFRKRHKTVSPNPGRTF